MHGRLLGRLLGRIRRTFGQRRSRIVPSCFCRGLAEGLGDVVLAQTETCADRIEQSLIVHAGILSGVSKALCAGIGQEGLEDAVRCSTLSRTCTDDLTGGGDLQDGTDNRSVHVFPESRQSGDGAVYRSLICSAVTVAYMAETGGIEQQGAGLTGRRVEDDPVLSSVYEFHFVGSRIILIQTELGIQRAAETFIAPREKLVLFIGVVEHKEADNAFTFAGKAPFGGSRVKIQLGGIQICGVSCDYRYCHNRSDHHDRQQNG